jgi:predicted ATPase
MRIIEFEIEGFRSIASQAWRPGQMNVVIGPNAGGKSNLLRALEMFSAAAQGRLGNYVLREGGIEPILFDGKLPSVWLQVKTTPLPPHSDETKDAVTYRIELSRLGTSSAYRINREILGNFCDFEAGRMPGPYKILERDPQYAAVYSTELQKFEPVSTTTTTTTTPAPHRHLTLPQATPTTLPPGETPDEEALLSFMSGPFSLNQFASEFRRELASWKIYQDFQTHRDATVRTAQVARADTTVDADGQNLIAVLHTLYTGDRNFEREIDTAMEAAFGPDYEKLLFPPAADQRIQLRLRWKSLERARSAADLSDGTLRFLYLITILANPEPPPLIAIDEPEAGLHPSMFPIVAEYARDAASRSQVVLTTHSPEFLDAFGDDAPTTTVVERRDGQTNLKVVAGDDLAYWLKQYTLGELFRSNELEALK